MVAALIAVVSGVLLAAMVIATTRREADDEREERRDLVRDMASVALRRLENVSDELLVRVAGTAQPRDTLVTAPLSGRPCIAYRVELYLDGKPAVVREESDMAIFRLESENAAAIVVPPVAILALATERLVLEGETLTPTARAWIDESFSGEWVAAAARVVERRIEPGDRITVVGWARTRFDDTLCGYRDAGEMVMFADAEGAPLSLADDASLLS